MEDRRASWVAVAFGGVALGGFWFARPERAPSILRVVSQWVPDGAYGLDADAVTAYRLDAKGALREAQLDGRMIEYRVVDRQGHGYDLQPMKDPLEPKGLKLVNGYPKDLEDPRIVAYIGGVPSASVAITPIPKTHPVSLVTDLDPSLVLFSRGGDDLAVKTTKPIPKDEVWRVRALRTPFAEVDSTAEIGASQDRDMFNHLHIPYGNEVGKVEVEVVRYRLRACEETVEIPKVRLAQRFGGTATFVDAPSSIPSRYGATIRLPKQDNGARRTILHGDTRVAVINLSVLPPVTKSDTKLGMRRMRGPTIEILSPSPESLGLREMRLGGAVRRAHGKPVEDLSKGIIVIKARLVFYEPVECDRFRAVVPVVEAPPSFGRDGGFGVRDPSSAAMRVDQPLDR